MFKKTQLVALTSLASLLVCMPGTAQDYYKDHTSNMNETHVQTTQQDTQAAKTDKQNIDMKKLSEAFGHFIGRNLQSPGLKFDMEALIKGIREGAAGQPAPMSEKEYEEMMAAVQEKAFKEMSSTNLQAANDFMTKNAQAQGVTEIVPGKLQFITVTEGHGPVVGSSASPLINYTGKYLDGTVFGTSEEMGGPITIPLDQTIPGFSKGIAGMKEGEKRRLFVHPDLGYGTSGQLPPNELLIFEVEVVKAESDKKDAAQTNSNQSFDDEDDSDDSDDLDNDSNDKTKSDKSTTKTQQTTTKEVKYNSKY